MDNQYSLICFIALNWSYNSESEQIEVGFSEAAINSSSFHDPLTEGIG